MDDMSIECAVDRIQRRNAERNLKLCLDRIRTVLKKEQLSDASQMALIDCLALLNDNTD